MAWNAAATVISRLRVPVGTAARMVAASLLGFAVGVGVFDVAATLTGTAAQPAAVVVFGLLLAFLWYRLAFWVLEPLMLRRFGSTGHGWVVPVVRAGDRVVQATIKSPEGTVKLWVVVRSYGIIEGFSGPIVVPEDAILLLPTATLGGHC